MRNFTNSVAKIKAHKGPLSKAIVCYTAKQTLNQYSRGWRNIQDTMTEEMKARIKKDGVLELLEAPLLDRKLDKALTAEGIEWLRNFMFTSKGKIRQTLALRYVPGAAFDIVQGFTHFTFAGFFENGNNDYAPGWRVHSKLGSFIYVYTGGRFAGYTGSEFRVFGCVTVSEAA